MLVSRDILSTEHGVIAAIAAELMAAAAAVSPEIDRLMALRGRLNRHLVAHLVKEDHLLYPALKGSADPGTAAMAADFAREMGGLSKVYRAYMAEWPPERIAAKWSEFQRQTRDLLKALDRRIEREETELYPRIPS